jgi:2-oxoglutarate dehydrogenase E1 component
MSFLDNISPQWIEEQYLLWKQSPGKLSLQWETFFSGFELALASVPPDTSLKQAAVQALIHRHRDIGHLLACTDPLTPCKIDHPLLSLHAFGLDSSDLDLVPPAEGTPPGTSTLREILSCLRETYCRSIGVEFMHVQDPEKWQWLVERMETSRNRTLFSPEQKLSILRGLQQASLFESFLHRKFIGQTRFSLEGGETLVPMLQAAVDHASGQGITDIILGMPHRGRLNIQAHIFRKPYENIFAEFRDTGGSGFVGDGDVRYHGGVSSELELHTGAHIHLTLVPNPSHLESIDPVVEGKSRARQDRHMRNGDNGPERVLPVLIHGDAAFSGQGIVAETLNMSRLEGYRTGGTLHLVLNNQIGFTTLPADARSTRYATDVAKMLAAPIFHVHCEDPEAAIHVVGLALDFRREFACDVVVELICYRRYGHNEGHEPYFTQPLMYERIKERPPAHVAYENRLRLEGVPDVIMERMRAEITERLDAAFSREPESRIPGFRDQWSGITQEYAPLKIETGVARDTLTSLSEKLSALPPDFTPHPKVASLLGRRSQAVKAGEGIDWANGETLAFATLLHEGITVRLSGQDSRRGTFSQRHCVLHDIRTEKTFTPLMAVSAENAAFYPYDSLLSEAAVLGFEYGHSLESPETLTIWEAQYGDFANGAQVIIDQFITSGETKWRRASGLVMFLPHGYEGHGAEHSSARVERFLQLCSDANIQVTFPSTPAQFFHLLRRQMKQPFRKPLVVLTPKSLLRNPSCVSGLDEFSGGWFREILPSLTDPEKAESVLLCCGKLYYELREKRQQLERDDVAIIRIEQLYPLRSDLLREELGRFRHARRFAWVQEEPANMGAWPYLRPYLEEIIGSVPRYVGRRDDACPAAGSHRQDRMEQERLVADAFAG